MSKLLYITATGSFGSPTGANIGVVQLVAGTAAASAIVCDGATASAIVLQAPASQGSPPLQPRDINSGFLFSNQIVVTVLSGAGAVLLLEVY